MILVTSIVLSTHTTFAGTASYTYSALNRLQNAAMADEVSSDSSLILYGYDQVGNRTSEEIKKLEIIVASLNATPSNDTDNVIFFDASGSSCFEGGEKKTCKCFIDDYGGSGSVVGGDDTDNFVYQYDSPGTYEVTLTVEFEDDPLTTDSKTISVSAMEIQPEKPIVDFSTVVSGYQVTLSASLPAEVESATVFWGNGGSSVYTGSPSNFTMTYTYSADSIYIIRVETTYPDKVNNTIDYTLSDDPDLTVTIIQAISSGDFGGDGMQDILLFGVSTDKLWLYQMNGNIILSSTLISDLGENWEVAGIGDFGGDGKGDILLRYKTDGFLYLYQMDGTAIDLSDNIGPLDLDWDVVGVSDFNGDSNADILLLNPDIGKLWMYQMDGNNIQESKIVTDLSLDLDVAGLGDFGGDGKGDILLRHKTEGYLRLYQMDGATIVSSDNIEDMDLGWNVAGISDFNGDGRADILFLNPDIGQLWMYQMDGHIITASDRVTVGLENWDVVGVGDFGGDGRGDILLRHKTAGYLYLYQMDGATIVSEGNIGIVDQDWIVQ